MRDKATRSDWFVSVLHRMDPDIAAKIERDLDYFDKQKARFQEMNDVSLAASAEYYWKQSARPADLAPGRPVYDNVLYHVIIPELVRRLRSHPGQNDR